MFIYLSIKNIISSGDNKTWSWPSPFGDIYLRSRHINPMIYLLRSESSVFPRYNKLCVLSEVLKVSLVETFRQLIRCAGRNTVHGVQNKLLFIYSRLEYSSQW